MPDISQKTKVGKYSPDTFGCKEADRIRKMVGMARIYKRKDRKNAWYVDYFDHNGKRCHERGGDTKFEANEYLRGKLIHVQRVRAKVITPLEADMSVWLDRPIAEHITDYLDDLRYRRKSKPYIDNAERFLIAWVKGCRVGTLGDIDPRRMKKWLCGMLDNDRSYSTHNAYLGAVNALINWCDIENRIASNPFKSIKTLNEKEDQRRVSRAMTPEELRSLIYYCPCDRRRVIYKLAGRMGIRWREIKRLRWSDFDLTDRYLDVQASVSKAKRKDTLPIPVDVLPDLVDLQASNPSIGKVIFDSVPDRRTWKRDLQRAGLIKNANKPNESGYITDKGQFDRKCLRKTTCTHYYIAGVDIREAQKLMRHKDINLTMEIYTGIELRHVEAAADKVASLFIDKAIKAG